MFGLQTTSDLDGSRYIFIQTVPYYANRVAPIFDQPDLKGKIQIDVVVPSDWYSISTGRVAQSVDLEDFNQTSDPVSSLLDSLQTSQAFLRRSFGAIKDNFEMLQTFSLTSRGQTPQFGLKMFGESKLVSHEQTPPLPSYLLNLVCGPFNKFTLIDEDQNQETENPEESFPPMAVYCRKSITKFVEPELKGILVTNKAAISFYEKFFNYKYPFNKLDLIFCPEFKWSAMEMPAAITCSETQIPLRVNNKNDKNMRSFVLLHEISHMWIGNLVTMKWWDDLWLNESIAEFICHLAAQKSKQLLETEFRTIDPWLYFLSKKWTGYRQDAGVSTHPISLAVRDTEAASTIFDGITYSKGASVLKCLYSLVGYDSFSRAMSFYFKKFEFRNTELVDLLECLQQETTVDLIRWRDQWIMTAGYNYLQPELKSVDRQNNEEENQAQDNAGDSQDAEISRKTKPLLIIHQGSVNPRYTLLRYHAINVALYNHEGEILSSFGVKIQADSKTSAINLTGIVDDIDEIAAVLVNHEDIDFVQTRFDQDSLMWFINNYGKIEGMLSRALVIRAYFDYLSRQDLDVMDFVELFKECVNHEQEVRKAKKLPHLNLSIILLFSKKSTKS